MSRKRRRVAFSDFALSEFQNYVDFEETLKAINVQVTSKVAHEQVDTSGLIESQQMLASLLVTGICKMLNIKGKVDEDILKQYKAEYNVKEEKDG